MKRSRAKHAWKHAKPCSQPGRRKVHQFQFLKNESIEICRCGGWAVGKKEMTALRAQKLAKIYGKNRFGPDADAILRTGVPFQELTEDQALQDWNHHVMNLPETEEPEKGGRVGERHARVRVNTCAAVKRRRLRQRNCTEAITTHEQILERSDT